MNGRPARVVVLISGSGSNLQALIDAGERPGAPFRVVAAISNRPGVFGLKRASRAGVDAVTLDHKTFDDRETFDARLAEIIDGYRPDIVTLAGFMRILTAGFVVRFRGRLLNIHPSLLPKYPGLDTHQRALDAGDHEAGCTVHFVTEELDGGPQAVQARVPIEQADDAESLAQRVLGLEHRIYPLAIDWLARGRLALDGNRARLDGELLPPGGWLWQE